MHDYCRKDIVAALRQVGLVAGAVVYTHSNVGFFGQIEGMNSPENVYSTIKDAVFEVIGPGGTWVVPAFSYSFCKKAPFDPDVTPGICGFLSECVRKDGNSLRSFDANFSVAAIGKSAQYLVKDAPPHSFGPGSFWEKFLAAGGQICNFNFDAASTYVHYAEKQLKVPYRYDKAFPGMFCHKGKKEQKVFYHFVYDKDKPENGPEFSKFDQEARKRGLAKRCNLGKGQIVLISAHDTFELIKLKLQDDPGFLIKGR